MSSAPLKTNNNNSKKLSRKRVKPNLDDSSDDFVLCPTEPPAKLKRKTQEEIPKEVMTTVDKENDVPTEDNKPEITDDSVLNPQSLTVPPCPICGKIFKSSQSQARLQHLKNCGISRGLTPAQLVQVRDLEEKQAEERVALGLPAFVGEQQPTKQGGNSTTITNRTTKSRKKPTKQNSEDANLEMALALSASLAQVNQLNLADDNITEKTQEAKNPPTISSALSTATSSSNPIPVAITKRRRKVGDITRAKTALEVRTAEERLRKTGERVNHVLATNPIDSGCPKLPDDSKHKGSEHIFEEAKRSYSSHLWSLAGCSEGHHFNGVLGEFEKEKETLIKNNSLSVSNSHSPGGTKNVIMNKGNKENGPNAPLRCFDGGEKDESELAGSWKKLLVSGEKSDITVYVADEGLIQCHSLVLLCRCKKILKELITEEGSGMKKSVLCWYEVNREAAWVFLEFLYTARFDSEIVKKSVFDGVKLLATKYEVKSVLEDLKKVDTSILVPEDEEEEWDEIVKGDNAGNSSRDEMKNSDYAISQTKESVKKEPLNNAISQTKESVKKELLNNAISQTSDETENTNLERETFKSNLHQLASVKEEGEKEGLENSSHNRIISKVEEEKEEAASDEDLFDDDDELNEDKVPQSSSNYSKNSAEKCDGNSGNNDVWDNFDCDVLGSVNHYSFSSPPPFAEEMEKGEKEKSSSKKKEIIREEEKCYGTTTPVCTSIRMENDDEGCFQSSRRLNYESMLSPALRNELKKFGLKAIPRRKAIPLLEHIVSATQQQQTQSTSPTTKTTTKCIRYDVNDDKRTTSNAAKKNDVDEGDLLSSSQNSSQSSNVSEDLHEESLLFALNNDSIDNPDHFDSQKQTSSSSQTTTKTTNLTGLELKVKLLSFIKGNKELHKQALLYEPIWLEDLYANFKQETNSKCKLNEFTDLLDTECITFRTQRGGSRRQKKRTKAVSSPSSATQSKGGRRKK